LLLASPAAEIAPRARLGRFCPTCDIPPRQAAARWCERPFFSGTVTLVAPSMEALDALIRSHALPAAYRQMVDRVHRPTADRIAEVRRAAGRPIVAGLCGSQGSGKSTMAAFLKALLEAKGLKAVVLSIDDLYLTLPERERLAAEVHPLLKTRGVPGTHDVGLGHALLDVLSDGVAEVSMPRFDKAQDTRAPAGTWPRLTSPMDVILLEGWCVGAIPQTEAALAAPVNALERD